MTRRVILLSGPAVTLLNLVEYQSIQTPEDGRKLVER